MHRTRLAAIAPLSLILCAGTPILAADAFTQPATQTTTDDAQQAKPVVTHSSSIWKKAKYDINGTYRIERTNGGVFLVLGKDFKTKSGPDLKVVLSPQTTDRVKARTALNGGLVLGLLKSEKGESRYRIPEGTDLTRYRSVLIHCEEYTVLWGSAALAQGELVASGSSWTRKENKIEGRWEIARTNTGHVIRFGDDFKTRNAPDLKIVLSTRPVAGVKSRDALRGGTVVSLLKSNRGAQEFAIPANVDLSTIRSLLIHCEQYTKLWGGASVSISG